MSATVYVEGGGDRNKALKAECRRAFKEFFEKAGLAGRLPRVVPGGGRRQTYDDFCTAFNGPGNHDFVALLVDSEGPVAADVGPWAHLRTRQGDGWAKPARATDEHAHLMVQCMEAWFLADRETLAAVFGNSFRPGVLPGQPQVEEVRKQDVLQGLENAARDCQTRRGYRKGRDSFDILSRLDPGLVAAASPHAERFLNTLRAKLQPPPPNRARTGTGG